MLLFRVRGDCAPCTGWLRHREERMQSQRGRRRPCLPDKALPASGTRDEKGPEAGSAQEPQEGRGCAQTCSSKACPIQRHKRRREALLPLRGALCCPAFARGLIEESSRLGEDGGGDRGLALRQPWVLDFKDRGRKQKTGQMLPIARLHERWRLPGRDCLCPRSPGDRRAREERHRDPCD